MRNEFILAVNQVCAERQLSKEVVLEAVEAALVTAYKRNFGAAGNVSAKIDPETGEVKVYAHKTVVEEVKDPRVQISLAEARQIKPDAELGDVVLIETTPKDFGRIAAQTAKQVILQRIREAERDALYQAFAEQEGEIINGVIQSIDAHAIVVNLGKAEAMLPKAEQIPGERYRLNQRIRAYVLEVEKTSRGPRIVLSRAHRNMLRRLLELEVPEIANGAVEIKAIAREAGSRSKVAVAALRPGVDPVGSCVGMRGTRIQGIVNELNGEKIDVVEWSPDPAVFIANALSPAQVAKVHLYEDAEGGKTALVIVPDKQLSLAIGKEGQNARLAAKLTGWRIDIKSTSEAAAEMFAPAQPKPEPKPVSAEELLARAEQILASRPPAEEPEPVEETVKLWLDDEELPAVGEKPAVAEAPAAEPEAAVESAAMTAEEVEEEEEPATLDSLRWDPQADDDEFEPRSKPKDKEKRALLEFDEASGKLVVKRQRKPGRQRTEWEY
ncbi:MAG: transcription termination/antitermination protein NusA [Anaerolineae bacterium]|nr:transcription termination/antitermination protein NusA [Anaerolineae bacterium]